MKNILLQFSALLISVISYSQAKVSWGEEFKLHKGSSDLSIIKADGSGVYLEESHMVRSIGFWSSHERTSSILVKLSPTMSELYRKDYDKELKGKELETFFFIQDKLYLFASSNEKKTKTSDLYAVELDKESGNLKGDWRQVASYDMSEKGAQIELRVTPNTDTSRIIVTSTNTAKTENHYEVLVMDANLKQTGKPFSISNEFDPKTFQVEDFVYTSIGNPILVGRVYEYEEGKRKKDKNLLFKNYNIRIYDNQGKLKKELVTDIDGKFLVNSKVVQMKNEIILAAFYSNDKKKKETNGLLVQRMDPATGNILGFTKKELNNSLISEVEDDDDDSKSKKKEREKEKEDEQGLASNLVFRNFIATPDKGLVILAEKYKTHIVTSTSTMSTGNGGFSSTTTTYQVYESQDIYMSKISAQGNIDWLNDLPKNQFESIVLGSGSGSGGFVAYGYFTGGNNRPFFSGFGCLPEKNIVNIFFNDNEKNADVLAPGKKIKRMERFDKSDCFQVRLDLVTGKYTRKMLFSNRDIPPAMPRLGVVLNNTLYVTGKHDAWLGGKAKLSVGKISTM